MLRFNKLLMYLPIYKEVYITEYSGIPIIVLYVVYRLLSIYNL